MGNQIRKKLLLLSVCFVITSILIYWPSPPRKTTKSAKLSFYFDYIDGYTKVRPIKLEDNAFNMLDLDDYLYADYYQGKKETVNLYVGYYYTANKAYAAHSPLVCYPSQGWEIKGDPRTSTLEMGKYKINYEEVIASFGNNKELVVYWYQSHVATNTQVYKNKFHMAISKLKYNDEQHAFVRVSTPIIISYSDAEERILNFIKIFYPKFVDFIDAR